MKKAIIIGGGIGGLSIAARLLKKGFMVDLYEKNCAVGGKTNLLKYNNFKFDLTASLVMLPNDYIEIFSYCNKDFKQYFSLEPINPIYKVFYSDKSNYTFSLNLSELCNTINNIDSNDITTSYNFFKFLSSNYKKYLLSEKYFLNNTFINKDSFLNFSTIKKLYNIHSLNSCYKDCSNYISNEKLLNYLMFQSMYVGVSPYSSPSIYNLIPTVSQFNGLYYIKGGMYSYIKALKNLILDLGGNIYTSSPVNEILFDDKNNAIGVKIKENNFFSDLVVCSSDYSYSINNLIKNKSIKRTLKPIDNYEYSCSTYILYLGLNKKYPNLNIHNIYINKNFKSNLEAPFKGLLSEDPSIYIYCPSSIDDSLCPKGYETLNVILRVPNLLSKNVKWTTTTINAIDNKLLSILSSIDGLKDIKNHIVFKHHLTPKDFKYTFNTYAGSAFGISHNLSQSLFFRPQFKVPKVNNLYFTGASIHPGNGVSMVLKSSKICCDSIKN